MKLNWKQIITFGAAIVGYLIGSGFASGQEAMQFLISYGLAGCIGAIILTSAIYFGFCYAIMADGQELKLKSSNKIFSYYCGRYVGKFYELYIPVFLFMVFVVMLAGAGAIMHEYYGIPQLYGRVIMAILSFVTVLFGLNGVVNILSKIGPLLILFILIVGGAGLAMNFGQIAHADEIINSVTVIKAAPTWYISGVIFPSMGCMMITPFLATLGASAKSKKEAKLGGLLGAFFFSVAVIIFAFGLLANVGELYDKSVPTLFLATEIFPPLGMVFSVVLILGVYTTAVPMLWLTCDRVTADEKSKKFKVAALVFTIIGFMASKFPFATLVNFVYPLTGYLGIILLIGILVKRLKKFVSVNSASSVTNGTIKG